MTTTKCLDIEIVDTHKYLVSSLVKGAGKILGVDQTDLSDILQNYVFKKAQVFLCTFDHTLRTEF